MRKGSPRDVPIIRPELQKHRIHMAKKKINSSRYLVEILFVWLLFEIGSHLFQPCLKGDIAEDGLELQFSSFSSLMVDDKHVLRHLVRF